MRGFDYCQSIKVCSMFINVNCIDDIVMGQKLAEDDQADVFEADCGRDGRYVLKVFKKGHSLQIHNSNGQKIFFPTSTFVLSYNLGASR